MTIIKIRETLKKNSTLIIKVVGYSLSILIGVLLYRRGQTTLDSISSISISLLGSILITVIGILADINKNQAEIIANINKNQAEITESLGLSKLLNQDEQLRKSLYQLTHDYIVVSLNSQEKLFLEVAKTIVIECVQTVADLAKGKIIVKDEHKRLGYIQFKIGDANESVKAVTWLAKGEKNWWSSPTGKKYLEVQKEAINRGVKVTRIFIISNQSKSDLKCLMSDQKDIGIKVRAVREKSLPADLLDNFLICDDKWYTKSDYDRRGKSKGGLISINETHVSPAIQQWNRLFPQAKEILDVDKDIDQL